MSDKPCFKCGETKALSEFYKHSEMKDGHLNKCKACTLVDVTTHRAKDPEKYRSRMREYGRRPNVVAKAKIKSARSRAERPDAHVEYSRKWVDSNREKREAHIAVGNAVRAGRLKRLPCEICGADGEAHHDDYSLPLLVRWLCKPHHAEHYRAAREVTRTKKAG